VQRWIHGHQPSDHDAATGVGIVSLLISSNFASVDEPIASVVRRNKIEVMTTLHENSKWRSSKRGETHDTTARKAMSVWTSK
jgi:hypothetical protein